MSAAASVVFVEGSNIGEFDYGPFNGHACRRPAKKSTWSAANQTMTPAQPACWSVTVTGVDKAWREVRLPLKRGRTLKTAIVEACNMFKSPDDIKPKNGWFGDVIDYKEPNV